MYVELSNEKISFLVKSESANRILFKCICLSNDSNQLSIDQMNRFRYSQRK